MTCLHRRVCTHIIAMCLAHVYEASVLIGVGCHPVPVIILSIAIVLLQVKSLLSKVSQQSRFKPKPS